MGALLLEQEVRWPLKGRRIFCAESMVATDKEFVDIPGLETVTAWQVEYTCFDRRPGSRAIPWGSTVPFS
jgi:hypothetical protein